MTITTLAGLKSGLQPPAIFSWNTNFPLQTAFLMCSTWGSLAGYPAVGAYDSTLNGITLSSTSAQVPGQIPFFDPPSGNAYLARMQVFGASSTAPNLTCGFFLCDRLWHNGGFTITSTGAQTITSPTWPARDETGTTNGVGVLLGLEVSATVGAATPTISVSYTNSGGTAGRTGSSIAVTQSAAPGCSFYPLGLQAGDVGVQSVQSMTLSASWLSGTVNLVAYRVIAYSLGMPMTAIDGITGAMPRLFNGSVPFFLYQGALSTVTGELQYSFG